MDKYEALMGYTSTLLDVINEHPDAKKIKADPRVTHSYEVFCEVISNSARHLLQRMKEENNQWTTGG